MRRNLLLFSIFVLFFCSCKKDDELITPEEDPFGWEQVVFECTGITDSVYFHGYINGREFCYSAAGSGYHALAEYYDTWVTTSPIFPPPDSTIIETFTRTYLNFKPDIFKEGAETFKLTGPKKEIGIPKLAYYEDFIAGSLPLNDSSFSIMLEAPFDFDGNGGYSLLVLSTDKGDQTGSSLLLKHVLIYQDDDGVSWYGEFEFEINCKLYDPNGIIYYGNITEGILKLKLLL